MTRAAFDTLGDPNFDKRWTNTVIEAIGIAELTAILTDEETMRSRASGAYKYYWSGPLIAIKTIGRRGVSTFDDSGLVVQIAVAYRASQNDSLMHIVVRHSGENRDDLVLAFENGEAVPIEHATHAVMEAGNS